MKIDQFAAILYTVREHIKTPDAFRDTCGKLADIGFKAIQISGMPKDVMSEEEIVAVCAEHGLAICGTHEAPEDILEKPSEVAKRLQALGCRHTAYPYPAEVDLADPAAVDALIEGLDAAGKVLADAGLKLCYHNHHLEFRKLEGETLLERIYRKADAKHLQAELDTYWVQHGGQNPVEWCRKMKGRLPMLHLKDFRINSENAIEFAELGEGNLDFPAIIQAAEASGCEWFIVEQDVCPGNPFDSLEKSFAYARDHLISG